MKTRLKGRIEYRDKSKQLHRLDGPAVEWNSGSKEWYVEGKLHRLDGPACEYSDGTKQWYIKGKLHRLDGPACEGSNGYKQWYIKGKNYSEIEFMHKFYPMKKPEYLKNS